ncbi:MAG TPA: TadE/TadG family type IV pilus assembly protein [Caulobacteraceae bacterium]|jgi:Flp pilus assembly protein TadG|nr:TadE/TadG family type IV pilus assembly protein [Caulobacteraceae bacterium]
MPPVRPAVRRRLRAFASAKGGATAVEFAMISIPFLALLFAMFELGAMFMASSAIDAAVEQASRQIRTGQLQSGASDNAAGFKTLVCNSVSWISSADCQANLSLDVRTFSTFASINVTSPVSGGAIDQSQIGFTPGGSCDIVLVRAFYPWTLLTPTLEPGLPNLNASQRLLTATVAFRNENWSTGTTGCG